MMEVRTFRGCVVEIKFPANTSFVPDLALIEDFKIVQHILEQALDATPGVKFYVLCNADLR